MAYQSIIGRNEEIKKLEKFLKSPKSEFVAIYGRRRVGKSYLIEEVYKGKIVFRAIGSYIKDKDSKSYRQTQLDYFYESLLDIGMSDETPRPANWREAFRLLRKCLEKSRAKRRVVFLDELPWLAGPQSAEMITELGYFWNSWADRQRNIVLVVCGSATSWMLDNVIRDYGGLHGRLCGERVVSTEQVIFKRGQVFPALLLPIIIIFSVSIFYIINFLNNFLYYDILFVKK